MRIFYGILSTFVLMGFAFWAYKENYRTQEALRELAVLQREIRLQKEEMAILKAEWAYLNRPDRLRELAAINFDRLGLLPFLPDQFGRIEQVSMDVSNAPLGEDLSALTNVDHLVGVHGDHAP